MLIPEALTREKGCTIQLDRLLISDIKCSVFLLAILNKCGATAKHVVDMIYLAAVQHGWSHCIFSRFNQVLDRMLWGISRPLTKLDWLFWVCTRVGYSQILGFIIELIITFPLKMRIHWFLGYVSGQTQIIYCWWYLHDIPWYILIIFSILDLYPLHLYNDIAHDIPTIISRYSII